MTDLQTTSTLSPALHREMGLNDTEFARIVQAL